MDEAQAARRGACAQEVRRTIDEVCTAEAHAPLAARFRTVASDDGPHFVYRQAAESEDEDLHMEIPDCMVAARDLAARLAIDLIRQNRRSRTLTEEGGRHANPAWSLTLTRTMLAALAAAGYEPRTAGVMGGIKMPHGDEVVSLHQHQGSGLHYSTRIEVRTGNAGIDIIGGRTLSVTLTGRDVPDTVLGTMTGQPIRDVIGHAFLANSPAVITGVERQKKGIVFTLDDEFVAAAPPPDGVDVSWLGIGRTF